MVKKVFISSTYEDLKEYRNRAIEVVERYNDLKPIAMEFFMSQPQEPVKVCEKEIKECDIFVGIYAQRYGFIPDGEHKSITQLEYELAKESGKDCLCFIVDKDFSWKPAFIEFEKRKELEVFLEKVKKENVTSFFTTPADFDIKLSTSLGKLMAKQKAAADEKAAAPGACIPLAPTPFIAHPYPLPDHFTGREPEMADLSNWFYNEKQPVLVMEAIGGMGKSALTWVWMQKEIMEKAVEVDGVFWWSFYEAPFDSFLKKMNCYITKKDKGQESLLSEEVAELQAALHDRKFLLVLDGLERELRGYSGMNAMFIQEKGFAGDNIAEAQWEKRQREPVHPLAARFLQHLASGKSKILITSRLFPAPLEGLSGVKHVFLQGLSEVDAIRYLRGEGVKGTRAELEQAGRVYNFHPLMLKLLAASIRRSRTKDIQGAYRLNLIDEEKPHKILTTAFNLLSKEERKVASYVAVFRGGFIFESAKALFPKMEEERLWQVMQELRSLGFLFFDEKENRFDFHPIMRSFLYHSLTNRAKIHNLAVRYFQAMPKEEKIITLEDLAPVIELYHHLAKAGKFDEARVLFRDRIDKPTYYQLSAYHLQIELLKELFPDGEDQPPRLKDESAQAWTFAALANSYALSGQPAKGVPLYLSHNRLREKNDDKRNLAIGLGNAAQDQLIIGKLSASFTHLRKSIALCREIEDEFREAVGHQELGRVLAFQGRAGFTKERNPLNNERSYAEDELAEAMEIFEKHVTNYTSVCTSYYSLSALLQARLASVLNGEEKRVEDYSLEALEQARKALQFAEETAKTIFPGPRDFVRAYWLLGEALIQCSLSPRTVNIKQFEIPFYDEYFQQQIESVSVQTGNELTVAERCLNEALRRCRKVNLVEFEPDILLAHARLEWAKGVLNETILTEAHEIAQRSGYRLVLADLHLFRGQVLLQSGEHQKLLGLTAAEHLQKTREYALDVSEFKDLYESKDAHFYDGIPEYEMLKRGMNREEKIRNGYWIAYKIAEILEEKGGR